MLFRLGKTLAQKPICISAFVVAAVMPWSAHAEDLLDIYRLAISNDAQYLAAESTYEAAKVALPIAEARFKPDVRSHGTIGKQRSGVTGDNRTSGNNQLGISVGMLLYDEAANIGISQAELRVENAKVQFANAKNELTLRVVERYFNLLAARDNREVAHLQKVAIKRQMDLAAERLDVGLGTRTDLYDAQARFEQSNADLIAAEIQINNARQALIETISVTPKFIAALAENSPLDRPEPNNIDYWTSLAEQNNLLVKAEEINLLIASEEIDLQRSAKRPTLRLDASHNYNDGSATTISDGDFSSTSVGVTLNIPLYLGGSTRLQTAQAGLRFNSVEQNLIASKRRAATLATSAFLDVTSGISQVEALGEAIRAGENALEAREEGFSAGLTTNLDVLDAQRDLSRSRTDYLRAKYNYIVALIRLELQVGDLDEEDIKGINSWLDNDNTLFLLNQQLGLRPWQTADSIIMAQNLDDDQMEGLKMMSFDLTL